MPTPEASIGPMVDPHPMSFLTAKSYNLSKQNLRNVTINKSEKKTQHSPRRHTNLHFRLFMRFTVCFPVVIQKFLSQRERAS